MGHQATRWALPFPLPLQQTTTSQRTLASNRFIAKATTSDILWAGRAGRRVWACQITTGVRVQQAAHTPFGVERLRGGGWKKAGDKEGRREGESEPNKGRRKLDEKRWREGAKRGKKGERERAKTGKYEVRERKKRLKKEEREGES